MPFLLDTNIASELGKARRIHPHVWKWYDSTPLEDIFISAIVLGEMRRGIEKKRRRDPATALVYEKWLNDLITMHEDRILVVNAEICDIWGHLGSKDLLAPIDALIAATAIHHKLTIVTRNERDFQRVGVDYFNPFTGGNP